MSTVQRRGGSPGENSIKCISLWQPWATLVAIGAKTLETRGWSTSFRGRLAIHATKSLPVIARILCRDDPFHEVLINAGYPAVGDLPLGCIVATCELTGCFETPPAGVPWREYYGGLRVPPDEPERSFGDYAPGRFVWRLENVKRFPEPIPARGGQGLWNWVPPLSMEDQHG